jgi:flagellar hook assembly protein FlgD
MGGPLVTWLFENYPNPFTSSTTVAYSVARQTHVEIAIFNVEGRRVRTLVNHSMPAGRHLVFWDGSDSMGRRVGPGVYFYRLAAGSHVSVKKMIAIR